MARNNDYEKRRFVEAASMGLMFAGIMSNHPFKTTRQAVNVAGELYDEIEAQYPTKKEDNATD